MSSRTHAFGAIATLALLVLSGVPGGAQSIDDEPGSLAVGARVRVTLNAAQPGGRETRRVGRLANLDPESLRLDLRDSGETELRTTAIVRLERSVRPSRKAKTALIAFGVGFATWATVLTIVTEGECFDESSCAGALFGYSALLAVPAAAVGALVAPGEEWADVPLRRSAKRVASSPAKGLHLRLAPSVGKRNGLMIVGSF